MQELDVQPTNPTPYTPAGGMYNNNPQPGSGGLPALSGLTRNVNPMAQQLQDQGRGQDSVLVHMTPNEVNSLRGLAQQFGGDLSMNPNTGLPEAGFLSSILPVVAGIAGSFVGIPPWVTAAAVGGVTGIATGDLQKGLMAGLGAYGGASLGGALKGAGEAVATNVGNTALQTTAPTIASQAPTTLLPAVTQAAPGAIGSVGSTIAPQLAVPAAVNTAAAGLGATAPASSGILGKFGTQFGAAAREGVKAGTLPYKFAPVAAGLGLTSSVGQALQPELPEYKKEEDKWNYEGPYMPMPRRVRPTVSGPGEISYFEDTNPYPGYLPAGATGFAEGGDTAKQETAAAAPALNDYIKMFQTSPGPITASRTYPGGAPSELIRTAAQANAAKPSSEMDYGFAKTAGTVPGGATGTDGTYFNGTLPPNSIYDPSIYSPYVNSVLSQYYNPSTNNFDFSSLTPELIADYANQYNFTGRPADITGPVVERAKGGGIHMDDGAFVVDARTVSELGNGSSSAGQELLARLGGRPVKGPGDGVSDSIPANIGGKQKARVARDEVIFPAKAVKRLGGAKKLYALMDKAHKARKKAKRGSDTKLRKGLGAL